MPAVNVCSTQHWPPLGSACACVCACVDVCGLNWPVIFSLSHVSVSPGRGELVSPVDCCWSLAGGGGAGGLPCVLVCRRVDIIG